VDTWWEALHPFVKVSKTAAEDPMPVPAGRARLEPANPANPAKLSRLLGFPRDKFRMYVRSIAILTCPAFIGLLLHEVIYGPKSKKGPDKLKKNGLFSNSPTHALM